MISDHGPVSLQLKNILSKPKYRWRFSSLLIEDHSFIECINTRIDEFFATNDNDDLSDSTLWEAFKVVMRGHIISFQTCKKKELNSRLMEIEKTLPVLEEVYRASLLQSYNNI